MYSLIFVRQCSGGESHTWVCVCLFGPMTIHWKFWILFCAWYLRSHIACGVREDSALSESYTEVKSEVMKEKTFFTVH